MKTVGTAVVAIVAAVLAIRTISEPPSQPQSQVTGISISHSPSGSSPTRSHPKTSSFDPSLRLARLEQVERELYTGTGRNIFVAYAHENKSKSASRPQPTPDPTALHEDKQNATPELRMFGYAIVSGSTAKACLIEDGEVFIAGVGDIVDRRYKIERIHPNSVRVVDLWEDRDLGLNATE